ncbi:hypothetical protein OAF30_03230 [Flavobacteriales bacterium]|nr:hypothetical protein [Flavobacteriales bacterium]
MKEIARLIIASTACLIFAMSLHSQNHLHQVIVLNEGWSDWQTGEVIEPATMGVYDPGLQLYTLVDTLEGAAFVSDAVIFNETILVAADAALLQYDANTYELLQSVESVGIRKMAIQDGVLYVTRGDIDDQGMSLQMEAYFQWYDAASLQLLGELTVTENGPQYATEGIAVAGDRVYFAINNAFDWGNEVGFIGAYDTYSDEYFEWDLGENGMNPYHLFAAGETIVTVNNRDYGSTSLSALDLTGESVETVEVSEANAGCLAAIGMDSEVRYQISGEAAVRQSSTQDLANSAPWISDCPSYYGMAVDPVSGEVYASVTDYSTFGLVEIRSESGELLGQFDCGISPGVICMDVRELSSIAGAQLPVSVQHRSQRIDVLGRALSHSGRLEGLTLDGQGRKTIVLDLN